jgi:hypothetical protein
MPFLTPDIESALSATITTTLTTVGDINIQYHTVIWSSTKSRLTQDIQYIINCEVVLWVALKLIKGESHF